jgi:signal peptidase
MSEVRFVDAKKLFYFIHPILENIQRVRIVVTGWSMYPFLREHKDSVELIKHDISCVQKGDIVLIRRNYEKYVLHRITRKEKDFFYIAGDAQSRIEGPLIPDQLVAVVSAVWRGNKRISCTNPWWKFLSCIWLLLLPYRSTMIRVAKKVKDVLGV